MDGLKFNRQELVDLRYSLQREILCTNGVGGYLSTTLVGCNTRKYHGLMVCPVAKFGGGNYVLLSALDETVIQHGRSFELALHCFPGVYKPRGHQYLEDFRDKPIVEITYNAGGVHLKKELLWVGSNPPQKELSRVKLAPQKPTPTTVDSQSNPAQLCGRSAEQLLVRYTLMEAPSGIHLRLRPFLAFRGIHTLTTANATADGRGYSVSGGIRCRLYAGFPWLHLQVSLPAEFVSLPQWYYNFEYMEEFRRGYPFHEDLLTPGYFEVALQVGESVVFSGSTQQVNTVQLPVQFEAELAQFSNREDLLGCMRDAAQQFVSRRGDGTEIVAGYPWFGRWGRDTFIALPGILLSRGDVKTSLEVLDTLTAQMHNGLFPNLGSAYNSVDAPLWFFWTLQQLERHVGRMKIWRCYGARMKEVLVSFRTGINGGAIRVNENGLVWASKPGSAFTWMDAVVDGVPVTGRDGYQVEINALWYNAVCYTLELAEAFGDSGFREEWRAWPERIQRAYLELFWSEQGAYLCDFVGPAGANKFKRPNMVIACSMPYTMLSDDQRESVLRVIKRHLLTPRGLRTLSPENPLYKGRYEGSQTQRDEAYHNGTVWPWLLEHYVKANFDLFGVYYLADAEALFDGFQESLRLYGIGTLAEIYDGDPPHHPRGAISQAWSVGAVLRIHELIEAYRQPYANEL